MRKIKSHLSNALNNEIDVTAMDDPGPGGANHEYILTLPGVDPCEIRFQNGRIKEEGLNGFSNEAFLAVVLDRLDGFSKGEFSCVETVVAAKLTRAALEVLKSRTARREREGTEGTLQEKETSFQVQVRHEGNRVVVVTNTYLASVIQTAMSSFPEE